MLESIFMENKVGGKPVSACDFITRFLNEIPCGAAMNRIVCDGAGVPIDYVTTRVNPAFCALLGVTEKSVIDTGASEHLSREELGHWLRIFTPVALEDKTITFTMYSTKSKQAFYGTAICPERGMFLVMFARAEDWNPEYMHLPHIDHT
jgi:hypothetical protein